MLDHYSPYSTILYNNIHHNNIVKIAATTQSNLVVDAYSTVTFLFLTDSKWQHFASTLSRLLFALLYLKSGLYLFESACPRPDSSIAAINAMAQQK